ncbi:MAG: hypothetical protein ACR2KJ_18765 [Jatrophihabitans sp.]
MTVSQTVFGGSAVVESTLNWSPQQFDRQGGSAAYFYNDKKLYQAYYDEFVRSQRQVAATTVTNSTGWRTAGQAVSYAFDPSAVMTDPITNELTTLVCRPGDYVEVVNANVTRGRLVRQLNRLRAEGCAVRIITEQFFRPDAALYGVRHMTTHDKFVLVKAHTRSGAVTREVMTGSEDYRPSSMVLAEEQLVRIRLGSVVNAYASWFAQLWKQSS